MPLPKIKFTKKNSNNPSFSRKDIGLEIQGKNKTRDISLQKIKRAPGSIELNKISLKASTIDNKSGAMKSLKAKRLSTIDGTKESSLSVSGKNKDVYMSRTKTKGGKVSKSYVKNKK